MNITKKLLSRVVLLSVILVIIYYSVFLIDRGCQWSYYVDIYSGKNKVNYNWYGYFKYETVSQSDFYLKCLNSLDGEGKEKWIFDGAKIGYLDWGIHEDYDFNGILCSHGYIMNLYQMFADSIPDNCDAKSLEHYCLVFIEMMEREDYDKLQTIHLLDEMATRLDLIDND